MNIEELRKKITAKVSRQFDGVHNLSQESYEDSLNMIAAQILSVPEIALMIKLLEQTRDDCPESGKGGGWYPERLVVAKPIR